MNVIEQSDDHIVLAIKKDELRIINNALNEVCHALPRASFETRIGANLKAVQVLLDEVNSLLPD